MLGVFQEFPDYIELLEKDKAALIEVQNEAHVLKEREERVNRVNNWKKKYSAIDGTEYAVDIKESGFQVPRYCMRCLEPTNEGISYRGGFKLPVCPKCQKEKETVRNTRRQKQKQYKSEAEVRAKKVIIRGVLFSAIVSIILAAIIYLTTANVTWAGICAVILSIIGLAIFSSKKITYNVLGYDVLDDIHFDGFASVRLHSEKGAEFVFSNGVYAELFAEANNSNVDIRPKGTDKDQNEKAIVKPAKKIYPRTGRAYVLMIGVMLILAIVCGNVLPQSTAITGTSTSPVSITQTPSSTTKPAATLTPYSVYNGKMIITTDYECVCPFEIIADDNTDYYVYLKYLKAPSSSYENRQLKSGASSPYETDLAFYVKAGNNVEIDVPIGVYQLYYATGDTFYGTKLLFGDDTACYSSDDLLEFYVSSQYYEGCSITLYAVYNGNFDTDGIDTDDFPTG